MMKCEVVGGVSIPHRYGKNERRIMRPIYIRPTFPFLIGTVRTHTNYKKNLDRPKFPFLIGTVRTLPAPFDLLKILSGVSIPHRYGKNQ